MNASTGIPILVLGATGGQGGAVADALLARDARHSRSFPAAPRHHT
jgi:uncharacterized protein YbjT (DUF2867 family)